MRLLKHALTTGLFLFAATSYASPIEQKIVGGVEASIGEFPFIVSLQSSSHFCGGSLIRKNWVLTAAHCVRSGRVQKILIGLHDQKQAHNAEVKTPKRIVAHPQYSNSTLDFDYALIELDSDSNYAPVAVNETEIAIPSSADGAIMSTTAGWGTTSEGSFALPNLLQKVDVPLVTSSACNESYTGQITDRMICAGFEDGGKDSCQGDSGGPLIVKDENGQMFLAGVVSWGQGCARPKYYGVYSKVNAVSAWIYQTTGTAH
ncbi:MAG: serine protease [Pseudobdellovibrionaceae bacterium]